MRNNLLACPFCGDDVIKVCAEPGGFVARCLNCIAQSDAVSSIKRAEDAWNMRASPEERRSYDLGWEECRQAMIRETAKHRRDD